MEHFIISPPVDHMQRKREKRFTHTKLTEKNKQKPNTPSFTEFSVMVNKFKSYKLIYWCMCVCEYVFGRSVVMSAAQYTQIHTHPTFY